MDQQDVVLTHRWSPVYAGWITRESISLGICKMRFLRAGGVYPQVVFKERLTVIGTLTLQSVSITLQQCIAYRPTVSIIF